MHVYSQHYASALLRGSAITEWQKTMAKQIAKRSPRVVAGGSILVKTISTPDLRYSLPYSQDPRKENFYFYHLICQHTSVTWRKLVLFGNYNCKVTCPRQFQFSSTKFPTADTHYVCMCAFHETPHYTLLITERL